MNLKTKRPYFRHFAIELECPFEKANSLEWVKERMASLIEKLETQTLKSMSHLFEPQGISLVYIISSSHIAIHTWPENDYINIDFITCSKSNKLENLNLIVEEVFPNLQYNISELDY